jgi:hypothetical protein
VRPDNEALAELSGAVIHTIIDTYPDVQSYGFPLGTEWNGWVDAYEWAAGTGQTVRSSEAAR